MIKKLSEVLTPYIGTNKIIKDAKYTNLTKPGENYGSLMLKLDLILLNNDNNKEEELHLVAKTLSEIEYFKEVFQVQITYTNEMGFYDTIVPALINFQQELGVKKARNYFAKCYGTRKNLLENSDKIDNDTVLLFENLIVSGFANGDRQVGFDLDSAKFIIKDLADFHASFLALKIKKPDVFKHKVLPYCHNFEIPNAEDIIIMNKFILKEVVKGHESLEKLASKVKFWGETKKGSAREPWATLIHTDLWTNNTMQKSINGKVVENKFVDFQVIAFGSAASDVMFFLWTSVQKSVLENHLDYLLELYHKEFIQVLKIHDCDTKEFTFKNFLEEIKVDAETEFPHAFSFLLFLGLPGANHGPPKEEDLATKVAQTKAGYKEKIWFVLEECNRRGWM